MPPMIPTPEPRDFSRDYPEIAESLADQIKALTTGQQVRRSNKGGEAAILERASRELDDRMLEQGWYPATVYNLMPFEIKVNGVLTNDIPCPACPPDKPYRPFVITRFKKDTRDRGNGVFVPEAWVPTQLAKDFQLESESNKWFGVFWHRGVPEDLDNTQDRELKEKYEAAKKGVLRWARAKFREADAQFNSPNGDKRAVQEPHRLACSWLIQHGFLKEKDKPSWSEMTTDEVSRINRCPGCQLEAQQGAVVCTNCKYVFDPERAYKLGFIGKDSFALRRLPWKTIKALKLDKFITKDELIEPETPEEGSDLSDEEAEEREAMSAKNAGADTPAPNGTPKPLHGAAAKAVAQKAERDRNKSQQQKAAESGLD